jgi:hypothetical protein
VHRVIFAGLMSGLYFTGLVLVTYGLLGPEFHMPSALIGVFLFLVAFVSVQVLMMEN